MKLHHDSSTSYLQLFLALALVAPALAARNEKVLLSRVKSLTLRNDQLTAARRLEPIPQLKCVGGDANGFYEVDVMRCTNMGSDYGDEDISWSCTADVPKWFKLGSTDVLCEGYSSPDDPYILKGSCGVEYRLALTDEGYEKYGGSLGYASKVARAGSQWYSVVFAIIFFSVVAVIIYGAFTASQNNAPRVPRATGYDSGRPWFGGGGDDPPPPYDPRPPRKNPSTGGGWQPGFWSGMAAGAAGTAASSYMMGNRNRNEDRTYGGYRSMRPTGGGSSFAESSSMGAERHESTGFGQTRRR